MDCTNSVIKKKNTQEWYKTLLRTLTRLLSRELNPLVSSALCELAGASCEPNLLISGAPCELDVASCEQIPLVSEALVEPILLLAGVSAPMAGAYPTHTQE